MAFGKPSHGLLAIAVAGLVLHHALMSGTYSAEVSLRLVSLQPQKSHSCSSTRTPDYDITFKPKKHDEYKRRRMTDAYSDFHMMPPDTDRPVVFIGSKEHVPLFVSLTSKLTAPRTVFYRSGTAPEAPGCRTVKFRTSRVTNWQYGCADAFISGDLPV